MTNEPLQNGDVEEAVADTIDNKMANTPLPLWEENVENGIATNFHNHMVGRHKIAIGFMISVIAGQFMFSIMQVDAGELSQKLLLDCTNTARAEKGLGNLYMNEKLNAAAEAKLADMDKYAYWAHTNPSTNKAPWDFVDAADYYYETTGENLAIGFTDSNQICEAWRKSRLHYENLINPSYQEVGFAINKVNLHRNGKGILVVQMFGSRLDYIAPEVKAVSATRVATATMETIDGKILPVNMKPAETAKQPSDNPVGQPGNQPFLQPSSDSVSPDTTNLASEDNTLLKSKNIGLLIIVMLYLMVRFGMEFYLRKTHLNEKNVSVIPVFVMTMLFIILTTYYIFFR